MSWVLDASAALAWAFERTDPQEALQARNLLDRLASEEALVPELWHLEIVNALAVAHRRSAIALGRSHDFLARLTALPIRTYDATWADRREHLFTLAGEHRLTAYDAVYLDLAMRTGSALATFDRRLAEARDKVGIAPA